MPPSAGHHTIIDAHHHLWDLNAVHYPWLAAKGVKRFFGDPTPIQKNYLPADFKADIGDLPIRKSVHIQVGAADDQHLAESQWVQSKVDNSDYPTALVAYCALEKTDRSSMLDQLHELDALRGIRQIVGRAPQEDKQTGTDALIGNTDWQRGLRDLAQRGLRFDLQLIPDQMEAMYTVLSGIDQLPVAICHCGSPWYRDVEGWLMWKQGLSKLASLPNTVCKISGLSMFDHSWTVDSLRPVVDTVIEIFGTERCMFGSNFPVDKLHTDYQSLWHAYFTLTEQYSADEREHLFNQTCANFYSL